MVDYTKMNAQTSATAVGYDAGLRSYMLRIYKYMTLGLLLTGVISYFAGTSPEFIQLMITQVDGGYKPSMLFYVVAAAPLVPWAVYFFSHGRLSYATTQAVFWSYAGLMGLSMFSIFMLYTEASIVRVFFITAATFGGMCLYGYTTKRDLTNTGHFLFMGMWGVFIALIVNSFFLHSAPLDYALSILMVVIFTGITAYMNQALKQIYYQVAGNAEAEGKAAVFGAMNLYITFINLFMNLLRLFGDRR